jgi:hypothetical protein
MEERQPGPGILSLKFAGTAAAAYLFGGLAWLAFRNEIDWPIDNAFPCLEFVVHLVSAVVYFPCSFGICQGYYRMRGPRTGTSRRGRPIGAGLLTALVVWSPALIWLDSGLRRLYESVPQPPGSAFVLDISPFAMALFFGHVLVWCLPPWRRRGSPA